MPRSRQEVIRHSTLVGRTQGKSDDCRKSTPSYDLPHHKERRVDACGVMRLPGSLDPAIVYAGGRVEGPQHRSGLP